MYKHNLSAILRMDHGLENIRVFSKKTSPPWAHQLKSGFLMKNLSFFIKLLNLDFILNVHLNWPVLNLITGKYLNLIEKFSDSQLFITSIIAHTNTVQLQLDFFEIFKRTIIFSYYIHY